jgi:hypothetical protein
VRISKTRSYFVESRVMGLLPSLLIKEYALVRTQHPLRLCGKKIGDLSAGREFPWAGASARLRVYLSL